MRGYSENEAGDVVLTMSREDYNQLLMMLGTATVAKRSPWTPRICLEFVNRLNAGNPKFRPYEVPHV